MRLSIMGLKVRAGVVPLSERALRKEIIFGYGTSRRQSTSAVALRLPHPREAATYVKLVCSGSTDVSVRKEVPECMIKVDTIGSSG